MHSVLPTLLLIDVQRVFEDPVMGERNNPLAERNIASLASVWRELSGRVVHVKHNSIEPSSLLQPGLPGNEFMDCGTPVDQEPVFEKCVNSAFIGTGLEAYLQSNHVDSLVVAGFTTDHCVSTSVRMAANLGFRVQLVSDATATYARTSPSGTLWTAEQMHDLSLASLHKEFCEVSSCAELLAAVREGRPKG